MNKDAGAWFVEGEEDAFYAIVYFGRRKRHDGKMVPACEILPDWDAVLRRFAHDAKAAPARRADRVRRWSVMLLGGGIKIVVD